MPKPFDAGFVRRHTFVKDRTLNDTLTRMSAGELTHRFLTNPPAQHIYLYQTDYVRTFSELWFGRSIREMDVLDWGSGKGHITFLMRQQGARVVSCDLLATDVDDSSFRQTTPIIAEAKIDVVPLTDEVRLPFADASFDVVLSFGVLEHVGQDQASLHEIKRVLRPGGLFFCFFLPYQYSWTQKLAHLRGDFYHDHLYGHRQVQSMTERAGLRILDFWHRQLLPKNSVRYPLYRWVDRLDNWLCWYTPVRHLATNIEFVAAKE
ncbi:MAG: class I SAM-dependent methyltransferase [Catalinimonas sp.]